FDSDTSDRFRGCAPPVSGRRVQAGPVCGQAHFFAGVEQDSARMAKTAPQQQLCVEPFPKLVPPAEIGVQGPVWMKKIGTTMDPAKMSCRRSREAIHGIDRSEEHTSELQSRENLVCRLLLEKKKKKKNKKKKI